MKLPKLPPTLSRDDTKHGKLYCRLQDVREYGQACFEAGMQFEPFTPEADRKEPRSAVVDDLMSMMGMKK